LVNKEEIYYEKEKEKRRKAELRACMFPILENSLLISETRKKKKNV